MREKCCWPESGGEFCLGYLRRYRLPTFRRLADLEAQTVNPRVAGILVDARELAQLLQLAIAVRQNLKPRRARGEGDRNG